MTATASTSPTPAGAANPPGELHTANVGRFPSEHTIEKGDTYWDLSKRYYGTVRHTEFLKSANNDVMPIPGKKLVIPPPPATPVATTASGGVTGTSEASTAPGVLARRPLSTSSTPPPSGDVAGSSARAASLADLPVKDGHALYTVQRGDMLSSIARRFYGNANAVSRIKAANRHLHYQTLRAGEKILLPRS